MNYRAESQAELSKELNDLVGLGEESSKTIDLLVAILDRTRVALFMFFGLSYLTAGGAVSAFLQAPNLRFREGGFQESWLIGIGIAASFLAIGAIYLTYSNFVQLRKTRRDLRVEQDIHNRLMGLIDDQKRRLAALGSMSPVAEATLEMRLRRLDRTDRKQA